MHRSRDVDSHVPEQPTAAEGKVLLISVDADRP
jgi:hypothetical protein